LLEGFVGGVVLDEERFQLVVVLAYVGNLGARESIGNCGGWTGIEGNDKGFADKAKKDDNVASMASSVNNLKKEIKKMSKAFTSVNAKLEQLKESESGLSGSDTEEEASHFLAC
jgi:hypothetical protein